MNRATPTPHYDGHDLMSLYISQAGDPHVDLRPEYVAQLRSTVLARLAPARPAKRWQARLLIGSGLAAASITFALLWLGGPTIAWAQVAKALQAQPWVHGKVLDSEGGELFEQWLSASRD